MTSFQISGFCLALSNREKEKGLNNWPLEGSGEALGIRKKPRSFPISHFPTSHPLYTSGPSEDGFTTALIWQATK